MKCLYHHSKKGIKKRRKHLEEASARFDVRVCCVHFKSSGLYTKSELQPFVSQCVATHKAMRTILTLVIFVTAGARCTGFEDDFETCTRQDHLEIQRQIVGCQPRDTVVPLTLPNSSYMSVVPSHVTVKRCAGSCSRRYFPTLHCLS